MRAEIGTNLAITLVTALALLTVCVIWWIHPGESATVIGAVTMLVGVVMTALLKVLQGQSDLKTTIAEKLPNGNGGNHK